MFFMVDNLSKQQRSYCMSKIRGKNTLPEKRYKRKNSNLIFQPSIFGKPDFINYKEKIVIFIDGCFWHKCSKHYKEPKSNKKYWLPKLEKNVIRDAEVNLAYKNSYWKVLRIWEHKLKR